MKSSVLKTISITRVILIFLIGLLLSSCAGGRKVRKEQVATVISTAKSFTGTPYRYGGTTRAGMDCSGLILQSYSRAGIQLPRTSDAQSKSGKKVSIAELKTGDLVFFATGKRRRQVTHAGIVTDARSRGNIRFIHASTSLGVIEDNIMSDYWRPKFVRARRIIK
ncbi:C40 family peptidase [Penaeicola halotolerans]|uniref:C40 family peptidase n=1 Tax=Penaeicola halotolerans TaxID=2793196 RepID=UPI001CF8DD70|nr:C40 family peptidase [Penaeicola halotolerans]